MNLAALHESLGRDGREGIGQDLVEVPRFPLHIAQEVAGKVFAASDQDFLVQLFHRCVHVDIHLVAEAETAGDEAASQKFQHGFRTEPWPTDCCAGPAVLDHQILQGRVVLHLVQKAVGAVEGAELAGHGDGAFEGFGQFHLAALDHGGAHVGEEIAAPVAADAFVAQDRAGHGDGERAEVILDLIVLGRAQHLGVGGDEIAQELAQPAGGIVDAVVEHQEAGAVPLPAAGVEVQEAGLVAAEIAAEIGAFDVAVDQPFDAGGGFQLERVDAEHIEALGARLGQQADQVGAQPAFLVEGEEQDRLACIGGFPMDLGRLAKGLDPLVFGHRADNDPRIGIEQQVINPRNQLHFIVHNRLWR